MKPVSLISTLLLYVILSCAAAASGLAGPYPAVNSNDTVHDEVYPNLTEDSIPTMSGATRSSFSIPNLTAGMWPEAPHAAQLRAASMPTPALATGAAVFDVPLYTLSVDGVEIPFSLRYHSNGIKVEDDPFPVGYGWTLLPGLKITRRVVGRPDEKYERVEVTDGQTFSHAEMHRLVANPWNIRDSAMDPGHDIFTIHLPGMSFNAYHDNGKLVSPGHSDYHITVDSGFKAIALTDSYGNIWTYSTKGAQWAQETVCEWGLTEISLATGHIVGFTWTWGRHSLTDGTHSLDYECCYTMTEGVVFKPTADGLRTVVTAQTIQMLNLSEVSFPGGNINFNYTDGILKAMTLKYETADVGRITFTHESAEEAPLLQSVTLMDGGKYSFGYDPTRFNGMNGQDYWGYYNGKNQDKCITPGMTISGLGHRSETKHIAGCDRSVDTVKMKAMMLLKTVLPTGGTMEWEYEPHRFSLVAFRDRDDIAGTTETGISCGGGLRVKKITMRENTSDSSPRTVSYIYGRDGGGLANIVSLPTASTFLTEHVLVTPKGVVTENTPVSLPVVEVGVVSAHKYSGHDAFRQGEESIWYDGVSEIHGEGKVVHEFAKHGSNSVVYTRRGAVPSVIGTLFSGGIVATAVQTYRKSGERCVVSMEDKYEYSDETGDMITEVHVGRKRVQTYDTDHAPDFTEGFEIYFDMGDMVGNGQYRYGEHDIYEASIYHIEPLVTRLKSKTHTEYTANLPRTVTEEYTYVPGTMRRSSVTLKSDAQSVRTDITYSGSYVGTVGAAMKAANAVGIITGKKVTVGSSSSEWKMTYSSMNNGKLFRPTEVKCRRGSAALHSTGTYVWNSDGTLKSAKDPAGVETAYTWDIYGRYPLTMTLGGTLTSKAEWKPLVGVSSLTDPAGMKTSYGYDSANRLASVSLNGKLLESYEYAISQTGQNSVTTKKYTSNSSYISTVERYDGLGRVWGTFTELPDGWTCSLTEYDGMGRVWRNWAPAPVSSSSESASSAKSSAISEYSDQKPYRETAYESSPRGIVNSVTIEGEAWHDSKKRKKTERYTNDNGTRKCIRYGITSTGVSNNGAWTNGALSVTRETDEDGLYVETYTDLFGNTICVKRNGDATYYVYDDYGDLRYILPPGAGAGGDRTGTTMSNLAYWYDYDARGRCILKKLPGAKACRYVYDPADRLVAEQTHNHAEGKWWLYAYDKYGRKAIKYELSLTDSQAVDYASVCRKANFQSQRLLSGYKLNPEPKIGTPDLSFVKAWYYDNYNFTEIFFDGDMYKYKDPCLTTSIADRTGIVSGGAILTGKSMGKLTGFQSHGRIESYHYSPEGQEIQRFATGYNKGRRITLHNYDGSVSSMHHCYNEGETAQESPSSLRDRDIYFSYDEVGREVGRRIVERYIPMGESVEKTDSAVLTTGYDRVGRVSSRKTGVVGRTFDYDVRGWLRSQTMSSPRWTKTEALSYEDGPIPRYSGFVSQRSWNGNTGKFQYDSKGFMTYYECDGSDKYLRHNEYLLYDARSNVTTMDRSGVLDILPSGQVVFGATECIYGSFTGNRLTSVMIENFSEVYDRETGLGEPGTYTYSLTYDDAGRLISDETRGITEVSYDSNGFAVSAKVGNKTITTSRGKTGDLFKRKIVNNVTSVTEEETSYTGDGHVIRNNSLVMSRFDGGYFDYDGKPHYYLTDWQGNNIGVFDRNGSMEQQMDYYPYGEPWVEPIYSHSNNVNRYLFGGKERIVAGGVNEYDFGARTYVASQCRFTTLDPLAEKTPWLSPYAYCAGNPVNFIDPDGRHPIYSRKGNFLGTDDQGIKGPLYMLDEKNFEQGMSFADVERYAIKDIEKDVWDKIEKHYHTLPERPDYDGFVTIEEGIEWAKSHPEALKNPTPDNYLYVNTSLLDFGELSVSDFKSNKDEENIDLFKINGLTSSLFNSRLRDTVYALGLVRMELIDRKNGLIRIVNGKDCGTEYDWNGGGSGKRRTCIFINNTLFGINPTKHGFNVFYYGIGKIKK